MMLHRVPVERMVNPRKQIGEYRISYTIAVQDSATQFYVEHRPEGTTELWGFKLCQRRRITAQLPRAFCDQLLMWLALEGKL